MNTLLFIRLLVRQNPGSILSKKTVAHYSSRTITAKLIIVMMVLLSGCESYGIKPDVEEYAVAHVMASCGMGMVRINGEVYTRIEDEVLSNERIPAAKRLDAYQNYTRCIRKMPKHPTSDYKILHVMSVCGLGIQRTDDGFATRLVEHVFKTNAFTPEEKAEAYSHYTDCHEVLSKWIKPENSIEM